MKASGRAALAAPFNELEMRFAEIRCFGCVIRAGFSLC